MRKKSQNLIRYFNTHGGIIRFSRVLKAGFHPDELTVLIKEGKVEKIARGLYRLTQYTFGSHPDFVIASLQTPKGTICLLSALAFHEATTEVPHVLDIAIPTGARANKIKYPPVRFYHFAAKAWGSGVEEHRIEGHSVKIYGLAKTIADCFKFRNKIGIDVARDALKVALSEKGIKPKEVMKYAKICRVDRIVKPILEAMI